ncbi:integrase, catalytic region, zinc finger, CCHC-type containing protein [Tanacetum coccineum]
MSVIESLQRKTKEMEENAVSKEEMLKTNEKNDEGEDAEDDNSNDESSSHSSSSDEEEEEDDIEVHVSSSKEIPVELVQSVTTHCAYRGLRNKRTNKSRSFDHRVEKYNEPLRVSCRKGYPARVMSLRLNTRTCLRSDIEQHTQPLSFVGSIVLGLWLKFNLVKAIIDSHNKILYARHADQRKVTFQRVLQTGVEFDQDVRAMLLRANILKHEHIYACSRTALLNMAPLPPHEQRHPFLRYQGLGYSDPDIADFEERLERIHNRGTHRVQVLDFEGMPELMRDVMYARMRMEDRDGDRVMVFTSQAWSRVFETRRLLVRELILEFLSMLRFGEVLLDLDALSTIQFQLGGAKRRMSWREFILALGLHTWEEMEDISTDGDFLGPPSSYTLIKDLVLRLCHRKMAHSIDGGVAKEALVAPGHGDEDEEMPYVVPPPPRTQGERITRLEEEVHGLLRGLSLPLKDDDNTRYSESPVEYQRRRTDSGSTSTASQQPDP